MKIESIRIKNYKTYKDAGLKDIPSMAVFIGKNGVGKSTFFDVFGFLRDCLQSNVNSALQKRGGFNEVISRQQTGKIEFEIKFRPDADEPLTTYELAIGWDKKIQKAVVAKEILRFRRGAKGAPWKVLDFSYGEGYAASGEFTSYEDVNLAERGKQKLDSPDILAIKGLGQFKEFPAVSGFRRLVEDWYVANFMIEEERIRQQADYSERLSASGDNLAMVTSYMYENYRDIFDTILEKMKERVPGVDSVEAKITDDGYMVLKFGNDKFKNPFSSRFVSDGTLKMFTYLVLLYDPKKHALLCVEEPENQLYPELLGELSEEFQAYADKEGQVFVSTHSPDFLNEVPFENIYCIVKRDGFSKIIKATEIPNAYALYKAGDKPGYLWKEGLLTEGVSE
ncbi:MAG: AAA family ATPase [Lachnospiraceae bacterium]|nr:AAA family ATPase [Lachnospiraceae bacterium]